MDDIHPHWQAEDHVRIGPDSHAPNAVPMAVPARRHSAALVGIGLVLVLGVVMFGGMDFFSSFQSQVSSSLSSTTSQSSLSTSSAAVSSNTVIIHIRSSGIDPESVEVYPGQTVTWQNDSTLPHILLSETLKAENGATLYSPAIFAGTSYSTKVGRGQPLGSYTYTSLTAQDIHGEIVLVEGEAEDNGQLGGTEDLSLFGESSSSTSSRIAFTQPQSSSSPSFPVSSSGMPEEMEVRSSMPSAQRSSVPASPLLAGFVLPEGIGKDSAPDASGFSNQDELIPRNPYTVGSTRTPGNGVQNENLHSGAPLKYKPSTQPSTGSDVWLVLLTSLLTVAIGASVMMKKARV